MKPSRLETPPYGNATKRNTAIYNVTQRQARSALSALESFAMEREDAVAKLSHEKEELLEELKGARSGQDRSAEEVGCLFACVLACLRACSGREEKKRRRLRLRFLQHFWLIRGWRWMVVDGGVVFW